MSKKKLQPKLLIKSILKSTWEFLYNSILSWLLLGAGGILSVVYIFWDWLKEQLNRNITKAPILPKVSHLLFLLLLFLSLYLVMRFIVNKFKKQFRNKKPLFLVEGGFAWRINKDDLFVWNHPYCEIHRIKLLRIKLSGYQAAGARYNYYCSECNSIVRENVHEDDISIFVQIIRNRTENLKDSGKL